MTNDRKRVTLRMPKSLKIRIEQIAGRQYLTLNEWITRCLEQEVKKP